MMRKILILSLSLLSLGAFAQSASEEAIILNQEMQFLEESVSSEPTTLAATAEKNTETNDQSLERTYFGETEQDEINTRMASPKKRGF